MDIERTIQQIALGVFLLDKSNKKAFDTSLKETNAYLASLNPNLTEDQRLEILIEGMNHG